jgi:hypothetical protein
LEICGNSQNDRIRIGLKYIQSVRRIEEPSHAFSVEIQGDEVNFKCDNDKTRDFWIKVIRYYSDVIKAVQSISKYSMDIRNLKKVDFFKLNKILEFNVDSLRNNEGFFKFLQTSIIQKCENKEPMLKEIEYLEKVENPEIFFKNIFDFLGDYIMVLNAGKFDSKLIVDFPEKIEKYLFQKINNFKKEYPFFLQKEYKR